jgi:hypothetical protein
MGFCQIEQRHCVVVGAAGGGYVDHQALAVGAVQLQDLVGEGHRADGWMAEVLLPVADLPYFVALPEAAEVGALHDQLADERGQVGSVRVAAGDGPQLRDAPPGLLLPVGPQAASGRVQERVPDRVALPGRPLGHAGQQAHAAGVGGQQVVRAAENVSGAGAHRLQEQPDGGPDGP